MNNNNNTMEDDEPIDDPIDPEPSNNTDEEKSRAKVDAKSEKDTNNTDNPMSKVEESSGLEEEDRELIRENLEKASNLSVRRHHHGNSQARATASSDESIVRHRDEFMDTEEEEEEAMALRRKRAAPGELEKLFEEEEEGEEKVPIVKEEVKSRPSYDIAGDRAFYSSNSSEGDDDDMADFIEDEEEEAGEATELKEIAPAVNKREERRKMASMTNRYLAEVFGNQLPMRVIKDLLEVFGDGTDYLGMIDDDETDEGEGEEEESDKEDGVETEEEDDDKTALNSKRQRQQQLTGEKQLNGLILKTDLPETTIRREGINRPAPKDGELVEEAQWIVSRWLRIDGPPITNERLRALPDLMTTAVKVVEQILSFFRVENLEVPVVATHRKEYFQQLFGLNDLWAIWDADEQWYLFHRQRALLCHNLFGNNDGDQSVETSQLKLAIERANSLEELQLVMDYLRWRDRKCNESERIADQLVQKTVLPLLYQLADCILRHPINSTRLEVEGQTEVTFLSDSTISPVMLDEALPRLLAHHPLLCIALRQTIAPQATLSVTPTARGKVEITTPAMRKGPGQPHELSPWKYIRAKPVNVWEGEELNRGDAEPILAILRGQSLGLLNYQVEFGNIEQFTSRLAIQSLDKQFNGVSWSVALKKALEQWILPRLRKEIILRLRNKAEWWAARQAQYTLQDKLMAAPYDPRKWGHPIDEDEAASRKGRFRVMVVTWQDGPKSKFAVIVDQAGQLRDQRAVRDSTDFNFLLDRHRPSCVLVAADRSGRQDVRELYTEVEGLLDERRRRQSSKSTPALRWGEDDVARIYAASPRAQRDWPDVPSLGRYALSVARRWICPLFEITNSLDEAGWLVLTDHTNKNPNMAIVGREIRLKLLKRAFINVTNLVGVDLNVALQCRWKRGPLKFICGLGPLRANYLVQQILQAAQHNQNDEDDDSDEGRMIISSREQLRNYLPGPTIFTNCASFLRIHLASHPDSNDDEVYEYWDPLDDTRIHPENYHLARKMAADALEISIEEQTLIGGIIGDYPSQTNPNPMRTNENDASSGLDNVTSPEEALKWGRRVVGKVMTEPSKLDDLLLEEFARDLVRRGHTPKHLTLLDIKSELQRPYADLRPMGGTKEESIFEMIVGPTVVASLWIGEAIAVSIFRVTDRQATARLVADPDNPLIITVHHYHRQSRRGEEQERRIIWVRIREIRFDKVEVEATPTDDWGQTHHPLDPYYDKETERADSLSSTIKYDNPESVLTRAHHYSTSMATAKTAGCEIWRKVMAHPNWHPISRSETENLLRDSTLGEVIIRPAKEVGQEEEAILTWKIDDNNGQVTLFHHRLRIRPTPDQRYLEVISENGKKNSNSSGSSSSSSNHYEDIDEIIVREVEGRATYLREITAHPKFLSLPTTDPEDARRYIETILEEEANRPETAGRFVYRLSLARGGSLIGDVWLSYRLDAQHRYHELVEILPGGIKFRGEEFPDGVEAMLGWFKINWNRPPKARVSDTKHHRPLDASVARESDYHSSGRYQDYSQQRQKQQQRQHYHHRREHGNARSHREHSRQ